MLTEGNWLLTCCFSLKYGKIKLSIIFKVPYPSGGREMTAIHQIAYVYRTHTQNTAVRCLSFMSEANGTQRNSL